MADIYDDVADVLEDAEVSRPLVIDNPKTGEPFKAPDGTPATISFKGAESEAFKAAERKYLRVAARKNKDRRWAMSHVLGAISTEWHGWTAKGQPVPHSAQNVTQLLLKLDGVYNQVITFVYSHGATQAEDFLEEETSAS